MKGKGASVSLPASPFLGRGRGDGDFLVEVEEVLHAGAVVGGRACCGITGQRRHR
jgi:hypothetical protein